MKSIAIVTDSTCDLPSHLVGPAGIHVVPLTVILDGRSHLDGVDITAEEVYARLRAAPGSASTSQPSPGQFAQVYQQVLREYEKVISIHISGRLSGTLASARQAAEMLDVDRIRFVDSEQASMALGLLVLIAEAKVRAGLTAEQVVEQLEEAKSSIQLFCTTSTLEHLRHGGRIGAASALVGSMLQIKPILTLEEGVVVPLERVRTFERAIRRIVELARGRARGSGICAVVGHAAEPAIAARLAGELKDCAESLLIQPLGPTIGVHIGPGTIGIGCYPAELQPLGLGSGPA